MVKPSVRGSNIMPQPQQPMMQVRATYIPTYYIIGIEELRIFLTIFALFFFRILPFVYFRFCTPYIECNNTWEYTNSVNTIFHYITVSNDISFFIGARRNRNNRPRQPTARSAAVPRPPTLYPRTPRTIRQSKCCFARWPRARHRHRRFRSVGARALAGITIK